MRPADARRDQPVRCGSRAGGPRPGTAAIRGTAGRRPARRVALAPRRSSSPWSAHRRPRGVAGRCPWVQRTASSVSDRGEIDAPGDRSRPKAAPAGGPRDRGRAGPAPHLAAASQCVMKIDRNKRLGQPGAEPVAGASRTRSSAQGGAGGTGGMRTRRSGWRAVVQRTRARDRRLGPWRPRPAAREGRRRRAASRRPRSGGT